MIPEQVELFRICILEQLQRVAGFSSLPVSTLQSGAVVKGFPQASEDTVRSALAYLADKGLVAPVEKMLSPENKRWRITAAGTDFLAEAGL